MSRKLLTIFISVLFLISIMTSGFIGAYAAEFVTENGTITVYDAPDNGTLIVAAYGENNALLGCKMYNSQSETGTITANYAEDLGEYINNPGVAVKQFLWDMNTLKPFTLTPARETSDEKKAIVVYFSATGTTKALAETIAETAGADIFEIVPSEPYTSEDLNYNNDNCRANLEMNDESARPAIADSIENIDEYDTIFLGYPIWWGTMPRIINTFLDTYDLSGKTVMPFCTSGGSGISTSVSAIRNAEPGADVKNGLRGSSSTTSNQIKEWLDNAGFNPTPTPTPTLTPTPTPTSTPDSSKVLVAYFSCTNNTEGIAKHILNAVDADEYEIVPEIPYTTADLNYSNSSCRANLEQNDASARPAISGSVPNMEDYDIIFLGYPIWWGQAPKIIYTFLESYDFGGKTIVPFCTSASSGVGTSATNLHSLCPNTVTWTAGRRFASGASSSTVVSWIDGLDLDLTKK